MYRLRSERLGSNRIRLAMGGNFADFDEHGEIFYLMALAVMGHINFKFGVLALGNTYHLDTMYIYIYIFISIPSSSISIPPIPEENNYHGYAVTSLDHPGSFPFNSGPTLMATHFFLSQTMLFIRTLSAKTGQKDGTHTFFLKCFSIP